MGFVASAMLLYGFDLGDPVDGMLILNDVTACSWYDDQGDDDYDRNLIDVMARTLYLRGIVDADPGAGENAQEEAVWKHLGVRFETYGHHETSQWALVTESREVTWGESMRIDLASLWRPPVDAGMSVDERKLRAALAVLELEPDQKDPAWLLVASYG